jgi:uncharacterized membrane protein
MQAAVEEHASRQDLMGDVLDIIEYVAIGIEVLAVVMIVASIAGATARYIAGRLQHKDAETGYQAYRAHLGSGLLLGLEVLVAADVIRTVALEQTLQSVATLGVLVLVRIILGWSIVVEIEQRWPWQAPKASRSDE